MRIQSTNQMHIVLLADNSGSIAGQAAADIAAGIENWIYSLQMLAQGSKPYFRFSFILFGDKSEIVAENYGILDIDSKTAQVTGAGGTTNMTAALDHAADVISRNAQDSDCPAFVFVYTDGHPNDAPSALAAGAKVKSIAHVNGSPRVITLGYGKVNSEFLKALATKPEFHKQFASSHELSQMMPAIGTPTRRAGTYGAGSVAEYEEQITNI